MIFILIIVLLFLLIIPITRCILFHLPQYCFFRAKDLYEWFFKYKCNLAQHLGVRIFIANSQQAMRSGKTLSMVNYVINYYNQYNNKTILVNNEKKIQKIIIISNINIPCLPCLKFTTFEQLNTWFDLKQELEEKDKNSCYKCLFVIDEISAVCNNRQYKQNFNIANIASLVQMGHLDILGVLGSSQRFTLCDALLRQITDYCVTSRLLGLFEWKKRICINNYFLGHDLEEAQNDLLIKPIRSDIKFLYDKNYNCYNTKEIATMLTHSKDFLSSSEVLQNLNLHSDNIQQHNLKNKYKKKMQK